MRSRMQKRRLNQLSPQTKRFLKASRERTAALPNLQHKARFTDAFFQRYARRPFWERRARSLAAALEQEPVYLFADEQLVGMLYQVGPSQPPTAAEKEYDWRPFSPGDRARQRIEEEIEPHLAVAGAPGHIGWRWDLVLSHGVSGIMEQLKHRLTASTDRKARRLFKGALILWQAVLRWNDRHAAALEAKHKQASGVEAEHLAAMIDLCRQVPRYPARSFREALQSFHMQHLAVMFENPYGGNSPGRVDYWLWPYLERDLTAGTITLEQARELIDELFIRFHERLNTADKWVEAITVGGSHPDGSCAVNPLSYLMVESVIALEQTHPVVYPRICGQCPADFSDLCVEYLLQGSNRAQIYNDDACIPAIAKSGVCPEDAAMYMAGGCMEISVQGMASDMNFACTYNVAKTLELLLNGGRDLKTGEQRLAPQPDLTAYAQFEDLYAAFDAELHRQYRVMSRALDIQSEEYARLRPCFLLSSLIKDCLERGREQQDGGARYHDYGFSPLGITTAADALMGIKRAVFDEQKVAAADLLAALKANFHGYAYLRAYLLRVPKYGMEDSEADKLCNRVLSSVCQAAAASRNRFGGSLKPMIFNFVWTPKASQELAARADGSHAGDPIGHGMTPQRLGMKAGLTAAIHSATSIDYSVVSGGATTMWDMDAAWINFDRLKAILQVFFAKGGMIFQGNTTSVAELEAAMAHPEHHPNLIVRVGGFSALFHNLDRDLQREIISRHRHRA